MSYSDPDKERECKRQWYLRNKERLAEKKRRYYLENRERLKKRALENYRENREARLAKAKEYREENTQQIAAKNKAWYEANREEIRTRRKESRTEEQVQAKREYDRQRYQDDPQAVKDRVRSWELANPGKKWDATNRRRAQAQSNDPEALREYAAILSNDPCSYCGEPADTVDHIEPLARGGAHEWDNLTAACRSCNAKKHSKSLFDFY